MSEQHAGLLVAILGADGAGKSTVTDLVVKALPRPDLPLPAVRAYLGDDPPPEVPLLPTTRWLHRRWAKADAERPPAPLPAAGPPAGDEPDRLRGTRQRSRRRSLRHGAARAVSVATAMAEEYHQTHRATSAAKRGNLVFLDRHFYYDYYFHHIAVRPSELVDRLHGRWLERALPRPQLAICLDAPAEVLYARQPERTYEDRVARRSEYLRMADAVGLRLVDANRPVDEVVEDVIRLVSDKVNGRLP